MRDHTSTSTEAIAIGNLLGEKQGSRKTRSTRRLHADVAEFALADFLTVFLTGIAAKYLYLDLYLQQGDLPDTKYIVIALVLAFILNLFHEQMGLYKAEYVTGVVPGQKRLVRAQ